MICLSQRPLTNNLLLSTWTRFKCTPRLTLLPKRKLRCNRRSSPRLKRKIFNLRLTRKTSHQKPKRARPKRRRSPLPRRRKAEEARNKLLRKSLSLNRTMKICRKLRLRSRRLSKKRNNRLRPNKSRKNSYKSLLSRKCPTKPKKPHARKMLTKMLSKRSNKKMLPLRRV